MSRAVDAALCRARDLRRRTTRPRGLRSNFLLRSQRVALERLLFFNRLALRLVFASSARALDRIAVALGLNLFVGFQGLALKRIVIFEGLALNFVFAIRAHALDQGRAGGAGRVFGTIGEIEFPVAHPYDAIGDLVRFSFEDVPRRPNPQLEWRPGGQGIPDWIQRERF